MRLLLDGLDSPTRTKHSAPKGNHADLSILLDGALAGSGDWTDMETDFMTPIKESVRLRQSGQGILMAGSGLPQTSSLLR